MVVRARVHLKRHGADVRCQRTRNQHRSRPRRLVCDDHPRASVEQVGIGSAGTAALATGHRVRTDVARGCFETILAFQSAQDIRNDRILHRGDIGDDRIGKTQQRLDDHAISDIRGRRDDDNGGCLVGRRIRATVARAHPGLGKDVTERLPGTHVGGQAQRGGRGVLEIDAHSPGPQRQAQGRTQQTRSNDEDRPRRLHDARADAVRGAHSPTAPYSALSALPFTRRVVPCLR